MLGTDRGESEVGAQASKSLFPLASPERKTMQASSEDRATNRTARRMVRALAATGALAAALLAVSPALADSGRHHHNYYKPSAADYHHHR
jgi:hypothetical protein